jgi:hypothetical protein
MRHRKCRLRQKRLGALDTLVRVIAVRRDAERLLEGPAEVKGAQVRELGQLGKRHRLAKVLLDIGGHDTLLPGSEPASDGSLAFCAALVNAHELVRQHSAECFEIGAIVGLRTFD